MRFAIYMMIGPGEPERRRMHTLLRSLFRHEPATPLLVLVNDSGTAIDVTGTVPGTCEVVIEPSQAGAGPHHTPNILQILRRLDRRDDWAFAFKLDTDALVIAPFVERVGRYLQSHPRVGQVGQSGVGCDGREVDQTLYRRAVRRLGRRVQVWRSPRWGVAHAFFGPRAEVRRWVRLAAANGLAGGRHAQGGAYAVTRQAVRAIAGRDWLRADGTAATLLAPTDDLMLSMLVALAGFEVTSLTAPGEPFAVLPAGLPMTPQELADRGYALIHSVKNDARFGEDEIVRFFETRDGVSPARA